MTACMNSIVSEEFMWVARLFSVNDYLILLNFFICLLQWCWMFLIVMVILLSNHLILFTWLPISLIRLVEGYDLLQLHYCSFLSYYWHIEWPIILISFLLKIWVITQDYTCHNDKQICTWKCVHLFFHVLLLAISMTIYTYMNVYLLFSFHNDITKYHYACTTIQRLRNLWLHTLNLSNLECK